MCIRDRVYIDPAPPNVPGLTLSTEQWTNTSVTATVKDNGDAHSGVARTEYSPVSYTHLDVYKRQPEELFDMPFGQMLM